MRYFEGIVSLAVVIVPVGAASHAWLSRLRPDWTGALARLAEIVLGLSLVVCLVELLGSVSLFRTAAVVPVLAVAGAGAWWAERRIPRGGAREVVAKPPPKSLGSTAMNRVVVVILALLVADWATRTVDAFHHGMTNTDTLWYHLPFAARFVQDGSITRLHFVDLESVTAFFPANTELFHGLGILLMGNDVLSPIINLGWLALALLAGWCVGRPFGVGILSLSGVVALMATPNIVSTQPGGGYDDTAVLALVLTAAAILINTHSGRHDLRIYGIAIAALAAGLAVGTKFTALVPAAAMTVGLFVLARAGRRLVEVGVWLAGLVVTGAFWYIRNWVAVGNPIPSLHLKLGPISLPNPVITSPFSTWAQFILNGRDWRVYFFPGFRLAYGPVWWALLGLAAAGLVIGALRARGSMARMLAFVGLITAAGFVVSPQILAAYGVPIFFVDNIRYVDPAIALGLVLLPLIRDVTERVWIWSLLLAYASIVLLTQLDETMWPLHLLQQGFAPPITGSDCVVALLIGGAVLALGLFVFVPSRFAVRISRRTRDIVVLLAAASVVGAGFALQQYYLSHRYTSKSSTPPFGWAQSISRSRIAVAGVFTQLQYPLYGRELSNFVQFVGVRGPHGSYGPAADCQQWRRLLNQGHYRYVMTSTGLTPSRADVFLKPPASYAVWTDHDRHATLLERTVRRISGPVPTSTSYVGFSVYKLTGPLDVTACNSRLSESVHPPGTRSTRTGSR